MAVDSEGNVYIADSKNCVIRKVDTGGIISTYAGTGQRNPANTKACAKTDGTPDGPALTIALDQPKSLFMTRKSAATTRSVDRRLGQQPDPHDRRRQRHPGEHAGRRHQPVPALRRWRAGQRDAKDAELRHPEGVWVANDGTIYVTDGGNNLVRKIATCRHAQRHPQDLDRSPVTSRPPQANATQPLRPRRQQRR